MPRRTRYDLTTEAYDYPDWAGPPRQTLLVCAHPRSGSTLLGEALYFAGAVGCPLEYFHGGFRPDLAARWGTASLPEHVREVHRRRTDPSGVLSVKLFWRDVAQMAAELDPRNFGPDFERAPPEDVDPETYRRIAALLEPLFPHARHIHLWRRDRIRQAISSLTAAQTGLWREIPESGIMPPVAAPEYDFERIDALVCFGDFCHAHWRNYFAAIDSAPHEMTYEAVNRDYEATVAATLAWLGREGPVPTARMRRQSGVNTEAFVLRYLRDRAARTGG